MDWWNRFYCNEKRQTFGCECLPFLCVMFYYLMPSFLARAFGRASLWRTMLIVLYFMNASEAYQMPL